MVCRPARPRELHISGCCGTCDTATVSDVMTFQRCFRGRGCWQTPRLLIALAIAAGLSSPARAQAPSPAAEAEIDRAEAAWRAVAPAEYAITLVVQAFYPGAGRPFTFRVSGTTADVLGRPWTQDCWRCTSDTALSIACSR